MVILILMFGMLYMAALFAVVWALKRANRPTKSEAQKAAEAVSSMAHNQVMSSIFGQPDNWSSTKPCGAISSACYPCDYNHHCGHCELSPKTKII